MKTLSITAIALAAILRVSAETHTVHFENRCKNQGTPKLIQGPDILSHGEDHTTNGPLSSAIAYLDNGKCGFNGEGCTTFELTLKAPEPNAPGSGSSADITLIPPHKFSQPAGFKYTNGCSSGADCTDATCHMAFRKPSDTWAQVACQAPNAGLTITFC